MKIQTAIFHHCLLTTALLVAGFGCAVLASAEEPTVFDYAAMDASGAVDAEAAELSLRLRISGVKAGVGFTPAAGSFACWEGGQDPGVYPLNLAAFPWGTSGIGHFDETQFELRYFGGKDRLGGSWPCGMAAELLRHANPEVLRGAYAGTCPLLPVAAAGRDGEPTEQEIWDAAVTLRRCGEVYRSCWFERKAGGSPSTAVPVTESSWKHYAATLKAAGVCQRGLAKVQTALCSWPGYFDVLWLPASRPWCESDAPPPPGDCSEVNVDAQTAREVVRAVAETAGLDAPPGDYTAAVERALAVARCATPPEDDGGCDYRRPPADEIRQWYRNSVIPSLNDGERLLIDLYLGMPDRWVEAVHYAAKDARRGCIP